jgi:hypothetical protein
VDGGLPGRVDRVDDKHNPPHFQYSFCQ